MKVIHEGQNEVINTRMVLGLATNANNSDGLGHKDHKCDICGNSFLQVVHLKKHIKAIHEGQNIITDNDKLEQKNIEYKTCLQCKICQTDIHQNTEAFSHLGK